MTMSPRRLVQMPVRTSPARYSPMRMGLANRFRKLRDQTSSKKAMVTPCISRARKSHSSTAPSSAGTKLTRPPATPFSQRVMKPHSTMSIAAQANRGTTRTGLPRSR